FIDLSLVGTREPAPKSRAGGKPAELLLDTRANRCARHFLTAFSARKIAERSVRIRFEQFRITCSKIPDAWKVLAPRDEYSPQAACTSADTFCGRTPIDPGSVSTATCRSAQPHPPARRRVFCSDES